jgi:hypothetical protein
MSAKRLHIHSLPIVGLVIALVAVTVLTVMSHNNGADPLAMLFKPSLRAESGPNGITKISANVPLSYEVPGAVNRISSIQPTPETLAADGTVGRVVSVARSLPLQLAVNQALAAPAKR